MFCYSVMPPTVSYALGSSSGILCIMVPHPYSASIPLGSMRLICFLAEAVWASILGAYLQPCPSKYHRSCPYRYASKVFS
ncbi:hypothetical protein BDV29DRAFT_166119 [Aspergillus leporis]|uniref:Uncharacterized protein n=1 Tax=Aspergillus leporis TaxID=41062 RepID=A0A5N5XHI1_9EURO|nr:hypothetical protein BDV29DRAFT_166119 [Aspergillus leporis]